MRYGVYVRLSGGKVRPYRSDVRTRRKSEKVAAQVNVSEAAVRYGWRAFVLDRDEH
ncbi:hypothetical protein [Streptomyces sp. NPDC088183]|uniref:hypothetical protein n=1 Tax=Streptomyces sp. NPDC088183 TaxID=3160992 RepID=UPI00341C12C3